MLAPHISANRPSSMRKISNSMGCASPSGAAIPSTAERTAALSPSIRMSWATTRMPGNRATSALLACFEPGAAERMAEEAGGVQVGGLVELAGIEAADGLLSGRAFHIVPEWCSA